ncbi:MAG TPA: helix-turn-helix transcriptional regulator [Roseiflexaceae bacterium]|nr:helix-turn-helix transcriptional regulator [Roseiflexaceae bacterium]
MKDGQAMPVRSVLRQLLARENLRRAEAGEPFLTQQQISRDTGLPPSVINSLMMNKSQRVDFGTLGKLCSYFSVQPGDLLIYEEGEG